jgi:hypothetical protein
MLKKHFYTKKKHIILGNLEHTKIRFLSKKINIFLILDFEKLIIKTKDFEK